MQWVKLINDCPGATCLGKCPDSPAPRHVRACTLHIWRSGAASLFGYRSKLEAHDSQLIPSLKILGLAIAMIHQFHSNQNIQTTKSIQFIHELIMRRM